MTFFIMIKFWIFFFIFSILKSFQTQTYKIHIWSHSCNNYIKYELIYLQTEKIQIWHRDFIPGLSTTVKTTEWRFEGIRYKKKSLKLPEKQIRKKTYELNERKQISYRYLYIATVYVSIFAPFGCARDTSNNILKLSFGNFSCRFQCKILIIPTFGCVLKPEG